MNNQLSTGLESAKEEPLDIKISAAFGVFISEILDIEDLFRLVAKEFSVVENSDLDSDENSDLDSDEKSTEELNEDTFWNIKLYDDIVCEQGKEFQIRADNFCSTEFTYVKNSKIKIGYAECDAFMIYVGKSDTKPVVSVDVDEETLKDMVDWERKLLKEDRLVNGGLRFYVKRQFVGYI